MAAALSYVMKMSIDSSGVENVDVCDSTRREGGGKRVGVRETVREREEERKRGRECIFDEY